MPTPLCMPVVADLRPNPVPDFVAIVPVDGALNLQPDI